MEGTKGKKKRCRREWGGEKGKKRGRNVRPHQKVTVLLGLGVSRDWSPGEGRRSVSTSGGGGDDVGNKVQEVRIGFGSVGEGGKKDKKGRTNTGKYRDRGRGGTPMERGFGCGKRGGRRWSGIAAQIGRKEGSRLQGRRKDFNTKTVKISLESIWDRQTGKRRASRRI